MGNVKLKVLWLQRLFSRHLFINPGEIPMETVFFSSFRCDRWHKLFPEWFLLQQLFVMTTILGRAAYVWTDPFYCMGIKQKYGLCRMLLCHDVLSMCELAFTIAYTYGFRLVVALVLLPKFLHVAKYLGLGISVTLYCFVEWRRFTQFLNAWHVFYKTDGYKVNILGHRTKQYY